MPARTSCCGWPRCCTTSASRRPGASSPAAASPSTTTRWSARKLTRARLRGAALPEGRRRGRVAAGRAAPALPRLRRRRVDRLRRAPLRPRRRPAARPAAQADPVGLHHAQPAQGRGAARARTTTSRSGSRGCASRRSWTRSGPTSTATRSWQILGVPPGPGGRAGPGSTSWSCASSRGPLAPEDAEAELRRWWAAQPQPLSLECARLTTYARGPTGACAEVPRLHRVADRGTWRTRARVRRWRGCCGWRGARWRGRTATAVTA